MTEEIRLQVEVISCEICNETLFTEFKNGNRCTHPFCSICMIKYIRVQLNDNNLSDIPCPALDCDHMLDPVGCADVVGSSLFLEWCDVLCRSAISGLDMSYCPDTNCGALIVDECGGRDKELGAKCPSCKKVFCFKCKDVWHGRLPCRQDLERGDVAFLENLLDRKELRRCPKCRFIIQRISGCPGVKCRCGMKFCYDCGEEVAFCACPYDLLPPRDLGDEAPPLSCYQETLVSLQVAAFAALFCGLFGLFIWALNK